MFTHLRPRCGGSHSGPQPGTRDALPPWARTAHDGSTHPSPRATLFWHTCATVTAAGTGTIPATTPTARSTSRSRSPDRCRPSPSAIPWEAEQPCGQPLTPRCTSPRPRAMAAARRTRRAVERKASRRRTWRARPGDQPPSLRAVRQQGPNGRSLRRIVLVRHGDHAMLLRSSLWHRTGAGFGTGRRQLRSQRPSRAVTRHPLSISSVCRARLRSWQENLPRDIQCLTRPQASTGHKSGSRRHFVSQL